MQSDQRIRSVLDNSIDVGIKLSGSSPGSGPATRRLGMGTAAARLSNGLGGGGGRGAAAAAHEA